MTTKKQSGGIKDGLNPVTSGPDHLVSSTPELTESGGLDCLTVDETGAAPDGPAAFRSFLLAGLSDDTDTDELINSIPYTGSEEFSTVIAEVQARFDRMANENNDMKNLLSGTGIGTVVVDMKLQILRYTSAAGEIMNLVPGDAGRPFGDVGSNLVGYSGLAADIRKVIDTLKPKDIEVQTTEGKWYTMHILPCLTREKVSEGAMISFQECTKHKHAEEESRKDLEEKVTLLKEVHHRVKNNIFSIEGLLSMHADSVTNSEALSALHDALGRVKSMRVLYDILLINEDYESISVRKYTESLLDSLSELFENGIHVTITRKISEFSLPSKDLFHLGIIINELLTNVMKYGFAGRKEGFIDVTLKKYGRHITLTVQDDGVGFPNGFKTKKTVGYGLMLVQMLSKQLGGTLKMTNRNGARSVLTFDAKM